MRTKVNPSASTSPRYRKLGKTARIQWAILFLVVGVVYLLWPSREPTPPVLSTERTNWEGFLAIAYGKIGTRSESTDISLERFRDHMRALTSAGYQPITLEEAHDFLDGRAPLPQRAILLTFDEGWRDTAKNAERVLLKYRYPAVFFLRLKPIIGADISYASWYALRSLAETGRWSLGVLCPHSHSGVHTPRESLEDLDPLAAQDAATLAAVGTDGEVSGAAQESSLTWEKETSARILREQIPDWGRSAFAFSRVKGIVAEFNPVVSDTFPLVFSREGYAFNHRGRPRDRLTRLKVYPGWSGEDLVSWLQCHGARRSTYEGGEIQDWVLRHGRMTTAASRITLEPKSGRGAEAWLAGSEHWRCVRGEMVLSTRPEVQAWLYLRSMPSGNFLRLGWTGNRIEVQAKTGEAIRSIARGEPRDQARQARISFDLLGRCIRFAVEDGKAPPRSFPVPEELPCGMAGLAIWFLEEGTGPVTFQELKLEPRLSRAALVNDIKEARSTVGRPIDVVAPVWYRIGESAGQARIDGSSDRAIALLTSYHGASLWPVVSVLAPPPADSLADLAREMEGTARSIGTQGILLDLRPARAAGQPLELEQIEALLKLFQGTPIPLGLIPDREMEEMAGALDLEKLSRVIVSKPEGALKYIPPERLLIADNL